MQLHPDPSRAATKFSTNLSYSLEKVTKVIVTPDQELAPGRFVQPYPLAERTLVELQEGAFNLSRTQKILELLELRTAGAANYWFIYDLSYFFLESS